jgi:hypothetical protein
MGPGRMPARPNANKAGARRTPGSHARDKTTGNVEDRWAALESLAHKQRQFQRNPAIRRYGYCAGIVTSGSAS